MTRTFFYCGLLLAALSLTALPGLAQAQSDGAANSSLAPVVIGGHSFAGLSDAPVSDDAPTVAGAIGPSSYIQAVNSSIKIYNRDTNEEIASGQLSRLAPAGRRSFNPQIIWDPTTQRFYYAMNTVSTAGNNLVFGFSKTANPVSISRGNEETDDWCGYEYDQPDKTRLLNYPRLGDSQDFIIIGVNSYEPKTVLQENFVGAGIVAISKPLNGSADPIEVCPAKTAFKTARKLDLRNGTGKRVFTPAPANQVDDNPTGYVVAIDANVVTQNAPSTTLWFFNVTRNPSNGFPVIGSPRSLTLVKEFRKPPGAAQPDFVQLLDTLDARLNQAVQAINPRRGTGNNIHSFWTQHTVKFKTQSVVRWYEIDPAASPPRLIRSGDIGRESPNDFFFNAAISPDRQSPDGTPASGDFGDSFVIQYNVVSRAREVPPRIVAASGVHGSNTLTFSRIKDGIDGYRDNTCPDKEDVCRWANYATASPDPNPPLTLTDRGQVWGSNQYAGDFAANKTNFRTWIFGVRP